MSNSDEKSLDNEHISTPWGELGYITYKRTYARKLWENSEKTEEFTQSIDRCLKASQEQLKVGFSEEELKEFKKQLLQLKCMFAGRFLWQLGTKTVDNLGLPSLQNCAFTIIDDPIKPFTWAMDLLMLGSGVGHNLQREYVYQLPKPKKVKIIRLDTKDADFIVPDTRSGWVELLKRVLEAHYITGQGFSYSTICIREKGKPIKGFGGVAAGAEELCWGMGEISKLLNSRAGKKVRPIDCLDIMNIIGMIVVAGNVRRSAQIAIGDMDDLQFLNAKNWKDGNIPNWRAMSNNSVVCNDINKLPSQFWNSYNGEGEPYGLINLQNSRKMGRTGDYRFPDENVTGFNPCGEQSLEDKETCCLAESFLPNINSYSEFISILKNLYRVCKHSLSLDCHLKETKQVVHKNMRMGIGVTGYLQSTDEQKSWLAPAYEELRTYDKEYSKKHGFPESIKLTTIKPSGTLSLLAGVTPGAHPGFSEFYLRRIRIASNSNLVEICRKNGYDVEYQKQFDGTDDRNTVVVSFPCKFPNHTKFARNMTAVDQLNIVKELQKNWSDNAVSVTVYYKLDELPSIQEWLNKNYNENIKSLSFLLHSEHGFVQAPLEEITEEQYLSYKQRTIPIHSIDIKETDLLDSLECSSGVCPIK